MRILLTTPPMRSFNVSGIVFTSFGAFNLARLAGNLPGRPGQPPPESGRHTVRIADYNLLRFQEHTLAHDIADFQPDLIGIANPFSGYTRGVLAMAKLARQVRPQATLVAGDRPRPSSGSATWRGALTTSSATRASAPSPTSWITSPEVAAPARATPASSGSPTGTRTPQSSAAGPPSSTTSTPWAGRIAAWSRPGWGW